MKILQLTVHFRPNIGGVETHLSDLCQVLIKRGFEVFVLTYRPLQAETSWQIVERGKNIEIIRIPWIPNLFYKLVSHPTLEFLYLVPGLFLLTPLYLALRNPDVVAAHGLVAGFVGVFWGKVFNKRVVIATHSIYHFPKTGWYRNLAGWIFNQSNCILGLSKNSLEEIKSLDVAGGKLKIFKYWVNLEKFIEIPNARKKLNWKGNFFVLYVGRLIQEKGIVELLTAAKTWNKNITLVIAGTGPLEENIKLFQKKLPNMIYLGKIDNDKLPLYYSAADVVIVPSIHEEGFGRVILESLSCGTAVIGSNRGAIPEAIDETVGRLIEVTPKNIKNVVEYFYHHPRKLLNLSSNSRKFAERKFAEKNVETIISQYQK